MAKKILAVDDERHIVRLVQVNLERAGYKVVTAYDGKEALDKVQSERPDLIVLDVMMPYMDGFEVLQTLKKNPATRELPVIMLTAYSDDNYVDSALDAGACAYLVKPITSEQLLPAIKLAIARFHTLQMSIEEATDLREALETRKLVERAKGILMERQQLSESDAFRRIQKISRDKCQMMKITAQEIIKASELL